MWVLESHVNMHKSVNFNTPLISYLFHKLEWHRFVQIHPIFTLIRVYLLATWVSCQKQVQAKIYWQLILKPARFILLEANQF